MVLTAAGEDEAIRNSISSFIKMIYSDQKAIKNNW